MEHISTYPCCGISAGNSKNNAIIRMRTVMLNFIFPWITYAPAFLLRKNEVAMLPNRAGITYFVAVETTGDVSTGCKGTSSTTPKATITVVTIPETHMAQVAITSPCSVPELEFVRSIALMAQGNLMLDTFPIIEPI